MRLRDCHVTFISCLSGKQQYLGGALRDIQNTAAERDNSKGRNKLFDLFANLPRKMSNDLEGKQSGKTVLIPVDGSENSKRAFQCE